MKRALLVLVVLFGLICIGCSPPLTQSERHGTPYLSRRAAHVTELNVSGPAPQAWSQEQPPAFVREIMYRSGDLYLKAWLFVPEGPAETKYPALVYFHGGFAFGAADLADCQPFIDAGFVVMTPMLRGENGNPGNCEMFLGEVDDGKAAIHWLHERPFVDQSRIYTFGHSAGGIVSAMLSLMDDIPIRHGGSSGGLYGTDLFDYMSDQVPFNLSDPIERELRVLPGNVAWMKRKHYAYIGREDELVMGGVKLAKQELEKSPDRLEIILLPGDHFTSLKEATEKYLNLVKSSGR